MEKIFSQEAAITFILVLSRIAGLITASPFFSGQGTPRMVLILFIITLSFIIFPSVPLVQTVPTSMYKLVFAVITQAAFGLLVGFAVSLVFAALTAVGALMDIQMGLGMAGVLDPTTGFESSIISRWHGLLVLVLFLGINGHHWLLLGVINSFKLVSLESSFLTPGFIEFIIRSFSDITRVAFNAAGPVIIAVLLIDVVSGVIGKIAPKLNILFLAIPFKITIGFAVMVLTMGSLVYFFLKTLGTLREPLLRMFYI